MSCLYSVVDYDPSCAIPAAQVAAGRRPSRTRQQRAEAEMLDTLAIYLDFAMLLERTLIDRFDLGPSRTEKFRCEGVQSC